MAEVYERVAPSHLVFSHKEGVKMYPVQLRHAWPSKLDLMARLPGLRLRKRWGGWRGEPFAASSARSASVYERSR